TPRTSAVPKAMTPAIPASWLACESGSRTPDNKRAFPMKYHQPVLAIIALASALALSACAQAEAPAAPSAPPMTALSTHPAPAATRQSPVPAQSALPRVVVTKSPDCGCCHLWVEHMEHAGFTVEVV